MSDMNGRRTPDSSGGSAPDNNRMKDSYELAYEEQLRKFTELDKAESTQPVPVKNVMGRDFVQHPNLAGKSSEGRNGSSRQPGQGSGRKPSGTGQGNSSKKKKKKKKKSSARREVHINRSEPLQFGMSDKRKKDGDAAVKKKSPVKKAIIIVLIIILVLVLLLQIIILRYVTKITYRSTGPRFFTTANLHSDDVLNILLIGSDTRDSEERGRTDSLILLSVDKSNKRTTMTSFMRDCYVTLPEYDLDGDGSFYGAGDKCKLNAAYVYGGAELLMDTIEYNFDVAVDKYIYIDFFSFIDIIDAVGGIDLDVTDEEAVGMQDPMREQNRYLGNEYGTDYLTKGGSKLHLNGNQALGYARLRYVGNADFQRTERQRTVISKLLETARSSGIFTLDKFASAICSHIETNMTKWEIYKLCYRVPFIVKYETKQLRVPSDEEYSYGSGWDGSSVLAIDYPAVIDRLGRELYGK
ncbi:MAG: LCP family protein [Ruminococcus sp.]|nr:LCP family protein [Ruminococcus sp.]